MAASPPATARIVRPFGSESRQRCIARFQESSRDAPWKDVYRLLLWVDKTTGLAHCYESDKCQPGKPWYPRSLRFHAWLSDALGATPRTVGDQVDWLFRRTADLYADSVVHRYQALLRRAQSHRAPFANADFPEAGEDPAIVDIIRQVLGTRLAEEPSPDEWRDITRRIRDLIAIENKRKNLVGEGFEDVLAAVVRAFDAEGKLDVRQRRLLNDIPGFANLRTGDKPNKVDLAILKQGSESRTLVTAKWSIRADREKQFSAEFASYVAARSDLRPFDYVLLTNEFDPARLVRACETPSSNSLMFSNVVHIAPAALHAVYGEQPESSMRRVLELVEAGRIIGLDSWLASLVA